MHFQRLTHNAPNAHARVQAAARILEDDLHVTTNAPHVGSTLPEYILALKEHLSRGGLLKRQDRAPHRGLAAARLTHQPQRLAATNLERHAVNRLVLTNHPLQYTLANREMHVQIAHIKDDWLFTVHFRGFLCRSDHWERQCYPAPPAPSAQRNFNIPLCSVRTQNRHVGRRRRSKPGPPHRTPGEAHPQVINGRHSLPLKCNDQ